MQAAGGLAFITCSCCRQQMPPPPWTVPSAGPREQASPSHSARGSRGWRWRRSAAPFAVTLKPWGEADRRHALSKARMGAGPCSAGPHSQHMSYIEGDLWVYCPPGWGQGSSAEKVISAWWCTFSGSPEPKHFSYQFLPVFL